MMKAFLSNRDARRAQLDGCGGIPGTSHIARWTEAEKGRVALAEAERILGETEPGSREVDSILTNHRSVRYLALTQNPSMVNCRAALAEALAGFLEQA
jgi:hypothetical protein